jgi:G3E family GTPase
MSELWTDEELEAAVVLDGVITVVDGRNVGRQLAEARPGGAANEAQLQVALADVILLNKVWLGGVLDYREMQEHALKTHCSRWCTWLLLVLLL